MQVTLTRRNMTLFDGTRLSSQEDRDMLQAIARLDLSHNRISVMRGMQYLGRLTELDLSHNALESLDRLPLGLRKLNVSHNNLTQLAGMAALTQLQLIDCSHNVVVSLAGLPPTASLRVVKASHNRLVSGKGLEACHGLRELDVSANLVADASSLRLLSSAHSLRILDVGENPFVQRGGGAAAKQLRAFLPLIEEVRGCSAHPATSTAALGKSGPSPSRDSSLGSVNGSRAPSSRPGTATKASRASQDSSVVMERPTQHRARSVDAAHPRPRSADSSRAGTPTVSTIASSVNSSTASVGADRARVAAVAPGCPKCKASATEAADLRQQLSEAQEQIRALQLELDYARRHARTAAPAAPSAAAVPVVPSRKPPALDASTGRASSTSTAQDPARRTAHMPATVPSRSGPAGQLSLAPAHDTTRRPYRAQPSVAVSTAAPAKVRSVAARDPRIAASSIPAAGAVEPRRRPSSADARTAQRRPASSGGLSASASRGPGPADRARSADRSLMSNASSMHKSVSFGPNQYFSPPSNYYRS
jgi:hypothetical protein